MFFAIKLDEGIFAIFENFDTDFGTLVIEIENIWIQIRSSRHWNKLCEFSVNLSVISLKNNQLACFLCHPVLLGRQTVMFYQACTPGYPADLSEPLRKISSLGLHLKVIFSNVRIKPHP